MAIEGILTALGSLPSTNGLTPAGSVGSVGTTEQRSGVDFANSLDRLIGAVENSGAQANQAVMSMTDGTGDVHDAMIALQRADLTLQLAVQVRNKLVNAYQEIMRMPV
jgi:flagellar hook-basal body complex protein FliE